MLNEFKNFVLKLFLIIKPNEIIQKRLNFWNKSINI